MKGFSIPIFLALLALAPMQAAAATNPAVTALLTQSREAQVKGDTELALRMAQAAIVADPASTSAYVALGDLYARAGQSEYARSYYDAALQIDPQDAAALRAIAALATPAQAASNTP
jgi:tetratricopeptide (TPR) repeat protein